MPFIIFVLPDFYLFLEVADFQGAGKIHSLVEKTDYNFFCVLWTQKGHKKQKLENEHENLAEGVFCDKTSYTNKQTMFINYHCVD